MPEITEIPDNTDRVELEDQETTFMNRNPVREPVAAVPAAVPIVPNLPGFTILSQIGRGGMGIVYCARQHSPERTVALKLIRRDWLESHGPDDQMSAIARFRTEADAAARLEHDHIVPIYQVGQVVDQHYYAMRYVEGEGLAEMLRNGPLENRQAAHWLEQVASAVEEAHRHGILHRDLKPQNILIDKTTRRALVTDFGLAKFVQQGEQQTRAGEILGTPAYMSPEQARDAALAGPAADIYSLGATLYHMLTARPPFQTARLMETLKQIAEVEPVAPRQLNPAIDLDLETICLKCLQKEPTRRYDSAKSLGEDLRLYREGRPIHARPIGRTGRVWRWCRRNPVVATLIGSVAVSLVCALGAITWGYVSTTAALTEKSAALTEKTAALTDSQQSLRQALKVVDEFCTQVSEDDLFNTPGLQPVRRELLLRALAHYQSFLANKRHRTDRSISDEVATAQYRVGRIIEEIGKQDEALAAYGAARELQQQLLTESPRNLRLIKALGDTANANASLLQKMGQLDKAASMYTDAARLRRQAVEIEPHNSELRRVLANTVMNRGLLSIEREEFDAAIQSMQDAQSQRTKLLEEDPKNWKVLRDLGQGHFGQGRLALLSDRIEDATTSFRKAAEVFEQLCRDDDNVLAHQYRLGVACRVLGDLAAASGELSEAGKQYQLARQRIEPLAAANRAVIEYQSELANLFMNEGLIFQDRGDFSAAHACFVKSHAVLIELDRSHPNHRQYQRDLAVVLRAMALSSTDEAEKAQSRAQLELSRDLLQDLTERFPDDPEIQAQLQRTAEELERGPSSEKPAQTPVDDGNKQ